MTAIVFSSNVCWWDEWKVMQCAFCYALLSGEFLKAANIQEHLKTNQVALKTFSGIILEKMSEPKQQN